MEEKNELIIANDIERRLREPKTPIVFPLMAVHRKELRNLKNKNIGDLYARLSAIKQIKFDEYKKKYSELCKKKLEAYKKDCDFLNKDYDKMLEKINNLILERVELEKDYDLNYCKIENSWDLISKLEQTTGSRRYFNIDFENITRQITEKAFNDKYSSSFKKVSDLILDLSTKYEEAINFGDLEIVKELYYTLKSSDKLFEDISKLEV